MTKERFPQTPSKKVILDFTDVLRIGLGASAAITIAGIIEMRDSFYHSDYQILLTFSSFPYIIQGTGHDGKMLFPGGQRERSHRLKAARRQEKKDTPEPSCESRRLNRVIGLKSGAA
ncbi:MAG: hypothetical protein IJP04_03955 [Clostridia bacterium]|nr:hypothetical protein [Clostridia bacterium]